MLVGTCRWLKGVPVRSLKVRRHGRQRNRRYPTTPWHGPVPVSRPPGSMGRPAFPPERTSIQGEGYPIDGLSTTPDSES